MSVVSLFILVGSTILCESACFLMLFLVSRVTEEDKRLEVEEAEAESRLLARREALRRAQREFDASLDALESLRRKRRVLKSQGEAMIHSVPDPQTWLYEYANKVLDEYA